MITTFVLSAVIGFAIGIFSGLLGIGGGTVMVPVFRLLFGMSPVGSTATSLFTIIPTSISGAVSHVRGKTCLPKLGIALGIGGAITSPLGVQLAQVSPGWLVMAGAAAAIGYSAFTMLRKALKLPASPKPASAAPRDRSSVETKTGDLTQEGGSAGAMANSAMASQLAKKPVHEDDGSAEASRLQPRDLAKAAAIGAAAGVVSGYVGLGGGFIMVPLMLSFLNMPMRMASGTSLIAVMILATPATVTQCVLGNVDYLAGIAIACGSIPGAALGARFIDRVPERTLRFVFAAFLGVAAILLVVKETGLMG